MKSVKIFCTLCLMSLFTLAQAQISESERSMTSGVNNALVLDIPDTQGKLVEKLWKSYVKDYKGKSKRVKKGDEMMSEGCRVVDINGVKPFTMYARTEDNGSDVEHIVWMDLGDEGYLSSKAHGDKYNEGEKFMMGFGLYVTKEKIKIELAGEQKTLKGYEGDLKKLKRDNESYHKAIEKAKETIAKMEANIKQNEVDQEAKDKEIVEQQGVIEAVKKRLSDIN